jgi:hypothetical protein
MAKLLNKKINLSLILTNLYNTFSVNDNRMKIFDFFDYEEQKSIIISSYDLHPDIPEKEKSGIIAKAIIAAKVENIIEREPFLQEIKKSRSRVFKNPFKRICLDSFPFY